MTVTQGEGQSEKTSARQNTVAPPSISLPKGGGAIHGMGEKFSVNPVNGTAAFTVPISLSPGRSGFNPDLSLSYDSAAGNGVFGLGWALSIPAISRKTEKGLPQYQDTEESDIFLLSGAEDLVLVAPQPSIPTVSGYRVKYYRPRIEGLFARIERWTNNQTGDTYWRSISKDNITTWYGKDPASRLADPADPKKVFSWLICESNDDKGNVIVYEYKKENTQRIDSSRVSEKNRLTNPKFTNQYLKRIKYGNQTPGNGDFLFEVVFDYGEQNYQMDDNRVTCLKNEDANIEWPARFDPFSTCRSGFEIRTYRRCERILMFHSFDELAPNPCLVRSTDFHYSDNRQSAFSYMSSVSQTSYLWDKQTESYLFKSLPPIEFTYSTASAEKEIHSIDAQALENLPVGIDGGTYQWIDLENEGISGILTEQADAWYFKHNLGHGEFAPLKLVAAKPSPGGLYHGGQHLMDFVGEGRNCLMQFSPPLAGYFEQNTDSGWEPFIPFQAIPNLDWQDPNLKFIDLNGDGSPDLLITEENVFVYHLSLAKKGFGEAQFVPRLDDEEKGPALVFSDATQSVYLADMSGDGLTDIVRIRNGEVCYWPNLGYGRFGPKITMDSPPYFEYADLFDQNRIRLADIDGTGATDIIYLGRDAIRCWFNQSGNGWSTNPLILDMFPVVDNLSDIMVVDLLGKGTACLVWSSPLPGVSSGPLKYIDLMTEKPHLLIKTKNNLGAETGVRYEPSTKFYLQDKKNGRPWITKLPFPVHCVANVTIKDTWRKTEYKMTYSYHHGYFDGIEREFRGFGRVEQIDAEAFDTFAANNAASPYITTDAALYQPPVKTVTWYHTGAFLDRERILSHFSHEYFQPCDEHQLPEPNMAGESLTTEEWREALRACKGMMLRQEVYELDVDVLMSGEELPVKLFSTMFHNCDIKMIQAKGVNRHAVFHVAESEAITYHYELDLRKPNITPDPRITHTLNLNIDPFGNTLQSVAVAYPRLSADTNPYSDSMLTPDQNALINNVQKKLHLAYTENRYTQKDDNSIDIDEPDNYRLRLLCETTVLELTGINPQNGFYFSIDDLRNYRLSDIYQDDGTPVTEIQYHQIPDENIPQKRAVEQTRILFFADNLQEPLEFGKFNARAIPYETYKLALTEELLAAIFNQKYTLGDEVKNHLNDKNSGYLNPSDAATRFGSAAKSGQYWIRSGIAGFSSDAAQHFYLPERYTDSFGHDTTLDFDKYDLYIKSSTDPAENTVSVEAFDYRVLAPRQVKDINDNLSEVYFDILGLPTAMALKGKGDEADNLDGFNDTLVNPDTDTLITFFTGNYEEAQARKFLGNATARYIYYFGEMVHNNSLTYGNHPPCACGILRERHVVQSQKEESPLQTAFEYSDGMGSVLVKKAQAEPEENSTTLRWIASGKTILNNKGNPVKQYEAYFSSNEHRFEETSQVGVTPVMYYDAVGRLIRTEMPDGTFNRVEFSPWQVKSFDPNDTILESDNTWYAEKTSNTATAEEQRAAALAAVHADTPSQTILDTLGREVISIVHNKYQDTDSHDNVIVVEEKYLTFTKLDAESKPLWICDDRKNLVMQYIIPPMPDDSMHGPNRKIDEYDNGQTQKYVPCYDIAGNLLFQHSMDAGDRWILNDAVGKPMCAWDNNSSRDNSGTEVVESRFFVTTYDDLHRPEELWLTINTDATRMIEQFQYGETISGADPKTLNLRGQLYQHFDQSGLNKVVRCDFKGNSLEILRRLVTDYQSPVIDWPKLSPENGLEGESYTLITEYDALNRMSRLFNWHQGLDSRVAVYEPTYNQRGLLEKEVLVIRAVKKDQSKNVKGYDTSADTQSITPIEAIKYNAKGQREKVKYGNQTFTRYLYDPKTFRLAQLRTTRPGYNPPFPSNPGLLKDDQVLQNLYYTYDPVGNITEINDDAYEPVFFNNQKVDSKNQYAYDALYRLRTATGRENCLNKTAPGQFEDQPVAAQFPMDQQTDPNALCNYIQYYTYDSVGNIDQIRHVAANSGSWTRSYDYAQYSNRLLRTWLGNQQTDAVQYRYDQHGNMLNLSNIDPMYYMNWDYRDMIQKIDLGGGGLAYYNYDSEKKRTRKVIVDQHDDKKWERIYLGGLEIFRKYNGNGIVEEIESIHLMEGERRLLLVEDVLQTDSDQYSTGPHFRYQYGNHLGSAVLELDEHADIISYEEYHPYGTSAYRAVNRDIKATAKRYSYTGKERDEESGLNYHGARYYAAWIGRWVSCDPKGLFDGKNVYRYVSANPILYIDPTGMEGGILNDPKDVAVFEVREAAFEAGKKLETGQVTATANGKPLPPPKGNILDKLVENSKQAKELRLKYATKQGSVAGKTLVENVKARSTAAAEGKPGGHFGETSQKLVPEVGFNEGKIISVGKNPGGEPAGARTADLAITKKATPPSEWQELVGKKGPEVLESTGDMKLGAGKVPDKAGFKKASGGLNAEEITPGTKGLRQSKGPSGGTLAGLLVAILALLVVTSEAHAKSKPRDEEKENKAYQKAVDLIRRRQDTPSAYDIEFMQRQGWVFEGMEGQKPKWQYNPDLAHEKMYQPSRWVRFQPTR